jgi:hypothetical protein
MIPVFDSFNNGGDKEQILDFLGLSPSVALSDFVASWLL